MATTSHARGHGASLHLPALLQAAQSDDRRAMDELLRRYEPLVRAIIARARPPYGCDREDLAQDARVGLLGAIRAWEPDRGPFDPFAARCARGQVIKALDRAGARKHQLLSRALSLDARSRRISSPDPDGDLSLYDVIPSTSRFDQPVAMLLAREQLDQVRAVVAMRLTAKERAALTAMLNDKSHQQLADEQGTTRIAITLALRRARHKLAVQPGLVT
jgi:RNA polymerase sporulation-specific sigma factor